MSPTGQCRRSCWPCLVPGLSAGQRPGLGRPGATGHRADEPGRAAPAQNGPTCTPGQISARLDARAGGCAKSHYDSRAAGAALNAETTMATTCRRHRAEPPRSLTAVRAPPARLPSRSAPPAHSATRLYQGRKAIAGNTNRRSAASGRLSRRPEGTTGWPAATPATGDVATIAKLPAVRNPAGRKPDLTIGNRPHVSKSTHSRRYEWPALWGGLASDAALKE
jgi:hypothetical protein